ncbi:MAG TPA: hypothetical protein VL326_18985 [Kofleriaceae bacterium]|nr:hypothetical protein [Kofleriaceae bacterium]
MWRVAIALGAIVAAACRGNSPEAGKGSAVGSGSATVEEAVSKVVATCAEANGTIEIRRKGSARWEKAEVGTTFRERDWVRTSSRSFGRLRFAGGGFLDLQENTSVLVDRAIMIEQGMLVGVADPKQPFMVKAADGSELSVTASGEGAEFRLVATATQGVEIAVTKGSLEVANADGTRVVNAGESAELVKQHLGNAIRLLPYPRSLSPGIDARFKFTANMTIPLVWSHVPDATHYYVQVARDTEFHSLVFAGDLTDAKYSFSPDALGTYAWRAAARDSAGRLGEFGFGRRIFCEADQPTDLLVGPRDGFKIDYAKKAPTIEFSWQSLGATKKYKLVVERDAPGVEPIVTTTTGSQMLAETLEDGVYYWGVYSIDEEKEHPMFLNLRQLTIHKLEGPKIRTEVHWNK